MRIIYESDVEEDFFEVVLTGKEISKLANSPGISKDFHIKSKNKNLNVLIRQESEMEYLCP